MLGLSLDKMLIFLVLAALVLGPHRLPHYAHRLATLTRQVRDALESMRVRAEQESGVSLSAEEWRSLDPRQYDPRAIIRDALSQPVRGESEPPVVVVSPAPTEQSVAPSDGDDAPAVCESCGAHATLVDPGAEPAPESAPRAQRWIVVGGTSGHPIRRLVDIEADDDPAEHVGTAMPAGRESQALLGAAVVRSADSTGFTRRTDSIGT